MGRTKNTASWWVDLGKRVASIRLVFFSLLHHEILTILSRQVLLMQVVGCLPDTRVQAHQSTLANVASLADCLPLFDKWFPSVF